MRAFVLTLVGGLVVSACGGSSQSSDASTGGSAGAILNESGGAASTGGATSGTGGVVTGGAPATGGELATGGSVTGGASTGGVATGGAQTGGASSGGAGTGGEPNACTGWHSESFAYGECAIVTGYPKYVSTASGPYPCSDSISNSATFCTPVGNNNPSIANRTLWMLPKAGETLTVTRGTWNDTFTECSSGPSCGK